jgi:membrane-bound lytic murein transglycosylase A
MFVFMSALNLGCRSAETLSPRLEPFQPVLMRLSPDEYPSFRDMGDRESLMQALRNQIAYFSQPENPPYHALGKETLSSEILKRTLETFLQHLQNGEEDLPQFIRTHFDVYQSTGENGTGAVTFTGYYIPVLEGSLEADEVYRYPVYRLPNDLMVKELEPDRTKEAVRTENGGEYPYYTREQIDQEGVLRNKGYEIAYLKDPLDRYLLHVQGSGTLLLTDGSQILLQYAGSNHYPYRSLRAEMLKDGLLTPDDSSVEAIEAYFSKHPEKLTSYLNRNRRYTFFRIREGDALGALGVPLTPERSIATDKRIFPAGGLSYIVTAVPMVHSPEADEKALPWSRFVIDQDEGGAIKGPHRVDVFWGSGTHAREIASHLNHPGKLFYLILKDAKDN